MTAGVVDRLQTDDVDVGHDEPSVRPAGTIDLVVEVEQPRRASTSPGELVGLGDRERLQQRVAVRLSLLAIARSLLAIAGRLFTVRGGAGSNLSCRDAVLSGSAALLRRAVQKPRGHRAAAVGVALGQLAITPCGGLIARRGREVARPRNGVTRGGDLDTLRGDLLASFGTAVAKLARQLMLTGVAAAGEIAIARRLVAVGRSLVVVRRSLVALGGGLIAVGSGLLGVRERLLVLGCPRRNDSVLVLLVAHPVPGIDVTITWLKAGHDGPSAASYVSRGARSQPI